MMKGIMRFTTSSKILRSRTLLNQQDWSKQENLLTPLRRRMATTPKALKIIVIAAQKLAGISPAMLVTTNQRKDRIVEALFLNSK